MKAVVYVNNQWDSANSRDSNPMVIEYIEALNKLVVVIDIKSLHVLQRRIMQTTHL